jgi:Ca2+-binding EF-hand superfamily protein
MPGILADRFFAVFDINGDGYVDIKEFVTGMIKIYYSTMASKIKFIFDL